MVILSLVFTAIDSTEPSLHVVGIQYICVKWLNETEAESSFVRFRGVHGGQERKVSSMLVKIIERLCKSWPLITCNKLINYKTERPKIAC